MADYLVTDTELASIADAIRTKSGGSAQMAFPADFVSEIGDLPVLDTSDANAGAGDIWDGKTAYVNGQKKTGTYSLENDLYLADESVTETRSSTYNGTINNNMTSNIVIEIPIPSGAIINKREGLPVSEVSESGIPYGITVSITSSYANVSTKKYTCVVTLKNNSGSRKTISNATITLNATFRTSAF